MRVHAALLLLALPALCAADWTPPAQPDPRAILGEAERDTQARRYPDALAKYAWFHEHALDTARGLYGLRLSRALQDWAALARDYPPALERLRATREAAAEQVRQGVGARGYFNEVVAIDRVLEQDAATRELFHWLDAHRNDIAAQVYDQAQAALVRGGEYALCGKYLAPDQTLARALEQYRITLQLAAGADDEAALREFARHTLGNKLSLLVGLLALNHRPDDANRIAAAALQEWNDPGFRALLGQALAGRLPEPWPL
jgi:hypothetical protein